jgi:hypothetical protein
MTGTERQIETLVLEVQNAFLNLPALTLTVAEAERQFGVDGTTCQAILDVLADAHVLTRTADGDYARFFPHAAAA